jgi:hypothetical protein
MGVMGIGPRPFGLKILVFVRFGRGGGDRKDKLSNKACALNALQPPPLSNRNKRNRRQLRPPQVDV